MFVANFYLNRCPGRLASCALLAVLGSQVAARVAGAQGTHLWNQSRMEEFEKGTPQGVEVTSDGHLRQGPGLTEIATTPSTYVWSVAAGQSGETYVGTASPASVLRIGKDGKAFTLFETKDVSVQVVRLGPDGALYAETLPSGRVYKLDAAATSKQDEASAAVVFDLGKLEQSTPEHGKQSGRKPSEKGDAKKPDGRDGDKSDAKEEGDKGEEQSRYIWDMTFDANGRLYIATGGPGAVYRLDVAKSGAKPELFFKSDEEHIRCLAWDPQGNLIAGSDGSGLVYRISGQDGRVDPQGKGYVLFEAPRREITSVAVDSKGTIYAASVGDKTHNPLPPLPVQGAGSITITVVQPQSLQAANTSSSLPDGSEIYAISSSQDAKPQAPRRVWTGKDEVVYAMAARPDGLLVLTGNRGRIFRIEDDGSYADLAHLEAQQGLTLAVSPTEPDKGAILIGTGNTGKLVRLGDVEKHEYASDVLDAGALARFGRIEVEPGSANYELLTRSGNVEQPVRGWSEWQPLQDGKTASPAGRFLEWKAVLHTGGNVGSVGVNYLPVNAAPVIDEMVVATGARINAQMLAQNQSPGTPQQISINFASTAATTPGFDGSNSAPLQAYKDRTAVTVRWASHDDNGDDLTYSLYLRGDGESEWRLLKDQITEKAYSFDAALVPDGGYEVKVVASDSPSNPPADALTGEKVSDRFEIDTTPPAVTGLKATDLAATAGASPKFSFEAEDAFSPIVRAEYSLDAGPWQFINPVGALSDSRQERYEFSVPAEELHKRTGERLITVRVYDRHDNVGVAKTVFTVPGK
jgi:WD40 repeat protein